VAFQPFHSSEARGVLTDLSDRLQPKIRARTQVSKYGESCLEASTSPRGQHVVWTRAIVTEDLCTAGSNKKAPVIARFIRERL
jgi:hypothetical protein